MKLKFVKDYTGRETAMQAYKAGAQADLPTAQALELIRLGVAREVWADIGKMFDPPAKMESPLVFSPERGDVLITELEEEAPVGFITPADIEPIKKPRKRKVKSDKNA